MKRLGQAYKSAKSPFLPLYKRGLFLKGIFSLDPSFLKEGLRRIF
jgi:hypothetical protein